MYFHLGFDWKALYYYFFFFFFSAINEMDYLVYFQLDSILL